MYKKYKIKKKNKFNIYVIFALLAIGLIFMSFGYALWSESLKIEGKANIKGATATDGPPKMNVDIPKDYVHIGLSAGGLKEGTSEVVDGTLTTILEKTADYPELHNNFTFYYTNQTGYPASKGEAKITITGNSDAIGTIAPSINADVANGVYLGEDFLRIYQ